MNTQVENETISSEIIDKHRGNNFITRLRRYFTNPNTSISSLCACILALIIFGMLMYTQKDMLAHEPKIIYYNTYFSTIPYDL